MNYFLSHGIIRLIGNLWTDFVIDNIKGLKLIYMWTGIMVSIFKIP